MSRLEKGILRTIEDTAARKGLHDLIALRALKKGG